MKILMVCTGNMCRSPFAEALLRKRLSEDGAPPGEAVEVRSAGTMTVEDSPGASDAVAQAALQGVDMSDHRTRQLGEQLLEDHDRILVMDRSHLELIKTLWPRQAEKVRFLSEFDPENSGKRKDITDPYGGSPKQYQKCFDKISRAVEGLLDELRSSAGKG